MGSSRLDKKPALMKKGSGSQEHTQYPWLPLRQLALITASLQNRFLSFLRFLLNTLLFCSLHQRPTLSGGAPWYNTRRRATLPPPAETKKAGCTFQYNPLPWPSTTLAVWLGRISSPPGCPQSGQPCHFWCRPPTALALRQTTAPCFLQRGMR